MTRSDPNQALAARPYNVDAVAILTRSATSRADAEMAARAGAGRITYWLSILAGRERRQQRTYVSGHAALS